jgi:transcription factor MBP1
MRRRHDDWINATHILKAAGFDKPARTRILEREVQKELHEKVQGGYGKYQGKYISRLLFRDRLLTACRNLGSSRAW